MTAATPTATAAVTEPAWLGQREIPDGWVLQLQVPADLLYFRGHFPDFPILPGVAQLHWAVHQAQQRFGYTGAPSALQAVKFHQVVEPEQRLELALTHNPARRSVSYRYESERGLHASGRLSWA